MMRRLTSSPKALAPALDIEIGDVLKAGGAPSVAHAVKARKIGGGFGARNHIIGGQRKVERGHGYFLEFRAGVLQKFDGVEQRFCTSLSLAEKNWRGRAILRPFAPLLMSFAQLSYARMAEVESISS